MLTLTQGQQFMLAVMTTIDAVRIAGLTKSFGDVTVLRGVDLRVARGSIVALLGSNGAGKTTIVKNLSTLPAADGGTVEVNGTDPSRRPSRLSCVLATTHPVLDGRGG